MKLESHLPRQSPWIYVTPLLNAILLLLVCFLFSSGFVEQSGIKVEKPRSSSRLTGFDRAHIVTLAGGDGMPMYFDGKKSRGSNCALSYSKGAVVSACCFCTPTARHRQDVLLRSAALPWS